MMKGPGKENEISFLAAIFQVINAQHATHHITDNLNSMKTIQLLTFFFMIAVVSFAQEALQSGPAVGDECPAFDPKHISGPDKGKKACPMCKYGQGQGVLIWWNTEDPKNIAHLSKKLEEEIQRKGLQRIRVFIMYMNPARESTAVVEKKLMQFSEVNQLTNVALTYIPEPTDPETAGLYSINPDEKVRNTIIVYKKRGAFAKTVNLSITDESVNDLIQTVARARAGKAVQY
jgi:hypothetical protein